MSKPLTAPPSAWAARAALRALSIGLIISWSAADPLGAQTSSTLAGTIKDTGGGVLPGAHVTASHLETGAARSTTTGLDGRFVLAALRVGSYEVRADLAGFRPLVRKGVTVTVGESLHLDLVMEVGGVEQEVSVTATAPLVNTQSSELSYLVSEDAIRDLPLNGRNYTDLALLQPGVTAFPHRDGGSVVAHGLAMSVNGQDPRSNVYLLDGTLQNDLTNGPAGSAAGTALGMDTIREFRVQANAYSAEFGRNFGGQVTVLTKSGTNDFHGSASHFHRNDTLDARNFFDPSTKPDFARNQLAGNVGGPIRLNQTFFFFGYEALRERLGKTISTVVPDDNARNGVLPDPNNPGGTITVPVSSIVSPYLNEFPRANGPNLGGGLAVHAFEFRQDLTEDFFQGRIDHQLPRGSQFFARYTLDSAEQRLPTDFPQFPRAFVSRNQFLTAEYRQIISTATLNTVRFGFSRTRVGQDVEANVGPGLQPFVPGRDKIGNIDIGGIPRFGPQTSGNVSLMQTVFSLDEGLVHTRGPHLLKLGGLIEHYRADMFNPTFGLGIFTFSNLANFLQNRPQRFLGLTPVGDVNRFWPFTLFGVYAQDDIRAGSRVTINAGLRYEFATEPRDTGGRDSTLINLSDPEPTRGRLYKNPTASNLSPRIGVAWDVGGDGRTSLRGGYGLYFNTNNQQNLIVTVTNPPATPRIIIPNPTFPVPPFERGIGNSMRPVQFDLESPRLHVWNVNLQRELWANTVVTVGYAASRGRHLLRSGDVNIPAPERLPDGTLFFPASARRPNPAFSTIELKSSDGNSWYKALVLEARRRWSRGFSVQSSYTWSSSVDTTQASTFFSDATNGTTSAFPEYPGFEYNKGPSDFDARHNWVFNFTWELPFARHLTGWPGRLLHGWRLTGIGQFRSGSPLTVFVSENRSRSQWSPSLGPGLGRDRPSLAPGRTPASAVIGRPDRYFDPTAFVLQPAGTFGNTGRGAFRGPNLRTVDLAAVKDLRWSRLGDDGRIELRIEAFNLLNRVNFGPPSLLAFAGTADNESPLASFGRIRHTVTSARQIQLGVRVTF